MARGNLTVNIYEQNTLLTQTQKNKKCSYKSNIKHA